MAFKPKAQGIINQGTGDLEDPADVATEPTGEPANEAAISPDTAAPATDAEDPADVASEPTGEPANEPATGSDASDTYSPEDQHLHDQAILLCHKLMYSKEGFAAVIKTLDIGKKDLGEAIGRSLANLLLSVQNSATKGGTRIPDDVIMDVGVEVLSDFMQIAVSSGLLKKEYVDKATARAVFCAFQTYGQGLFRQGAVSAQDIQTAALELKTRGIDPKQAADATGATQVAAGHIAKAQSQQPPPESAPPPGIVNQGAP